jgi:hypothetical protein
VSRGPSPIRQKQLHLTLSVDELRMLDEVATDRGLNWSDWVRQAIRAEFGALTRFRGRARKELVVDLLPLGSRR